MYWVQCNIQKYNETRPSEGNEHRNVIGTVSSGSNDGHKGELQAVDDTPDAFGLKTE